MDYGKNSQLAVAAGNGDAEALEELVILNAGLVRSCAARFAGRGTDMDDLVQIGNIGLIKAIRSFDASYGTVLSTYAVPLIIGEIKRYLRDDGLVKVSRQARQNYFALSRAKERHCAEKGSEPTLSELASECGISSEDAVYAMEAGSAVLSLDTNTCGEEGGSSLEQRLGVWEMDGVVECIALRDAISELSELHKKIMSLRFMKGFSQVKTAKILGLSQVKVSREERKMYELLKKAVS